MIPSQLQPLANHLWQSTLFAAAAGLLTLAFRSNRAQTRYWLWFAASVKFLIPFSVLVMAGSYLGRQIPTAIPELSLKALPLPYGHGSETLSSGPNLAGRRPAPPTIPAILGAVWAIGLRSRGNAYGFARASAYQYESDFFAGISGAGCIWGFPPYPSAAGGDRSASDGTAVGSDSGA
jgi:hypothetical protein